MKVWRREGLFSLIATAVFALLVSASVGYAHSATRQAQYFTAGNAAAFWQLALTDDARAGTLTVLYVRLGEPVVTNMTYDLVETSRDGDRSVMTVSTAGRICPKTIRIQVAGDLARISSGAVSAAFSRQNNDQREAALQELRKIAALQEHQTAGGANTWTIPFTDLCR